MNTFHVIVGLSLLSFIILGYLLDIQQINTRTTEYYVPPMTSEGQILPNSMNQTSESICTMSKRLELIQERCEHLGLTNKSLDDLDIVRLIRNRYYFAIERKHKVMYCPILKVASSTMVNLLKTTGGNLYTTYKERVNDSVLRDLATYSRVLVVRHPFDRLLSVFWEKFANPVGNYANTGKLRKLVIKRFSGELHRDEDNQIRLTLEQFLRILTEQPGEFWNHHWASFMSTCDPCLFRFTHIMRLETMDRDMPPLLARLKDANGLQPNVTTKNAQRCCTNRLSHVAAAFKDIPSDLLNSLFDLYRMDFQVFGYTWDRERGASCQMIADDHVCC